MFSPSRWLVAALPLSLALMLVAPTPARAQVCDLLNQLGACTPTEPELQFTPDGRIILPGAPTSAPSAPPPPSVPTLLPDAARRLLDLANQERAGVGAPALAFRDDVVRLATAHTQKMLGSGGGIFHNLDLLTKPLLNTLGAVAVGENVGWSTHLDDLHPRLMASPAHRAALLDPRFTVAGFAVMQDTDGLYYVTQDFVQPSGAAPAAAPAPPPAAPPAPETKPAPPPPPPPAPPTTDRPSAPEPATTSTVTEAPAATGDTVPAGTDVASDASTERRNGATTTILDGEVAGLVFEPSTGRAPGRLAPVSAAVAMLAAAILGQGWWWARVRGRASR